MRLENARIHTHAFPRRHHSPQVATAVGEKLGQQVTTVQVVSYKQQVVSRGVAPRPFSDAGSAKRSCALPDSGKTTRPCAYPRASTSLVPVLTRTSPSHPPLPICPLPSQVAGLKYKVKAKVNQDTEVVITAYKPLPHTGLPLEVQGVEVGGNL